ncbi:MAG: TRAP transporter substrate-binding protein DctP [Roseovarius sp.]|uniref:TRAP transporter substrate-binding protein n=1 Tax=Roseovarius sp. TaxID=1486281 RepID=UPI0032ED561B
MRTHQIMAAGAALLVQVSGAYAADHNWRYVGVINAAHDYAKIMIEGFERVEERTDGALRIEYVSYGETPYKATDALTLVRDGLVEMTEWIPAYYASTYPLLAGPELPFVTAELKDAAGFQAATLEAWSTPTISEYKQGIIDEHGAVSLSTQFYDPINIWFTDEVTDIEGMKGKKVRAFSPVQADFLTSAGASPVNIAAAEAYTGLQRGVIDGVITGAGAVVSFKWNEVLESGFTTNLTLLSFDMVAAESKLNELPEEVRAVLVEEMANVEAEIRELMPKAYEEKIAELKEEGLTITNPSPELYGEFHRMAVEEVFPAWAEQAGPQAEEILSDFGIELN